MSDTCLLPSNFTRSAHFHLVILKNSLFPFCIQKKYFIKLASGRLPLWIAFAFENEQSCNEKMCFNVYDRPSPALVKHLKIELQTFHSIHNRSQLDYVATVCYKIVALIFEFFLFYFVCAMIEAKWRSTVKENEQASVASPLS